MCLGKEETALVIRSYQHDIRRFFQRKIEWNMLYPRNSTLMKNIIAYSEGMKNYNQEGKFLHSLVKNFGRF